MFYYLDGTVAEILPYLAVIDCGGVGYACKTTNTTLAQLKKGQRGKLYTYLNVGEDVFDLYGFATQNELNSFRLLLGTFENEEFGTYTRYTYYRPEACVILSVNGKTLVLSGSSADSTRTLYDTLVAKTGL